MGPAAGVVLASSLSALVALQTLDLRCTPILIVLYSFYSVMCMSLLVILYTLHLRKATMLPAPPIMLIYYSFQRQQYGASSWRCACIIALCIGCIANPRFAVHPNIHLLLMHVIIRRCACCLYQVALNDVTAKPCANWSDKVPLF